jgi:protein phosphatase 1 regulatory subunit 7
MDSPKSPSQKTKIVVPTESDHPTTASSSSNVPADGPTSPGLRSSKSGWDGKLRITDLASASPGNNPSEDEGNESGKDVDTDEETLVEPDIQSLGTRTAVVTTGPTIPGGTIPADEDLLKDYEDDTPEIDAVHCRISSLDTLSLARFTDLERLCLRQNEITDISTIPETLSEKLEELDLYDNLIKHVKGLDSFTGLKSLDLSFNKIKHIKRVKHLKNLTDLYFVQNRIAKIEELEGLNKIRNLELGGNQLRVSFALRSTLV